MQAPTLPVSMTRDTEEGRHWEDKLFTAAGAACASVPASARLYLQGSEA